MTQQLSAVRLRSKFAFVIFLITLVFVSASAAKSYTSAELARWEKRAANVTITRDDWGIAHVNGKTDADAVFGAIYAQAEDDLNRVETNYLNSMGRLAEAEGESAIWSDLRMKLFIDPDQLKKDYAASPAWLKALMDAWADGLNFYLAKHPNVKPRVITHFEPWMALSFTEGSIGGDIESISLTQLRAFYDTPENAKGPVAATADIDDPLREPTGSNGIAIAPKNTVGKHALLLINPHTSFFFRSELQMTSGEGLNAYGAATWGQFFIYQGFNENCGWMHTSSAVDQMDEFLETITEKDGKYSYKHGDKTLPVETKVIRIPYRGPKGMSTRTFTVYRTQHGPVVRKAADGRWITISLMQKPVDALTQSYIRTKAKDLKEFKQAFELHSDSSNNTVYADKDGNIAYFHANFIPRRDPRFDWTKPVDGSDPATDWKGLLSVDESPNVFNPPVGWVYNSNDWPWQAAGPDSPKQSDYPKYVDNGVESARGRHVQMVLTGKKDFTLDSLRAAAYDSYLPWFEKPLPALLKAYDDTPAADPLKAKLAGEIAALRGWNMRWGVDSVPTSLAVFWAEDVMRRVGPAARSAGVNPASYISNGASREQLLASLSAAADRLAADFGSWKTPWGEINRFQRLTDDLVHPFTDSGPSIPVGFTSGNWGSIASFGARPFNGSKKWYGTSGNSFVAVVEFGPQVKAIAVTAGGESGNPASKHFNDQAERYATGNLREVYFYPSQLKGHTEKVYKPGM
jgi:acyl-homoserine lactone acylase PvdQ